MSTPIKYRKNVWYQIGGDMHPGSSGGTIAKWDGRAVEVLEIQPVREHVGDREALEVGFPFWCKEAYYDEDDLSLEHKDVQSALRYCGFEDGDERNALPVDKISRLFAIAQCCISYGYRVDEGNGGFAKDILGNRKVKWWGSKSAQGWTFLAGEDREFKSLVKEAEKEERQSVGASKRAAAKAARDEARKAAGTYREPVSSYERDIRRDVKKLSKPEYSRARSALGFAVQGVPYARPDESANAPLTLPYPNTLAFAPDADDGPNEKYPSLGLRKSRRDYENLKPTLEGIAVHQRLQERDAARAARPRPVRKSRTVREPRWNRED